MDWHLTAETSPCNSMTDNYLCTHAPIPSQALLFCLMAADTVKLGNALIVISPTAMRLQLLS